MSPARVAFVVTLTLSLVAVVPLGAQPPAR